MFGLNDDKNRKRIFFKSQGGAGRKRKSKLKLFYQVMHQQARTDKY